MNCGHFETLNEMAMSITPIARTQETWCDWKQENPNFYHFPEIIPENRKYIQLQQMAPGPHNEHW